MCDGADICVNDICCFWHIYVLCFRAYMRVLAHICGCRYMLRKALTDWSRGDIFENFMICRCIFEFDMAFSCYALVFWGRAVIFLRISWFAQVFLSLA